jgi:multisubunit Na+/H+ antiporter MnhB subunit
MESLMVLSLLFDVLLVIVLIWLAWRLLAGDDLFKAVVLFISFGLLLALAWARLGAPDVALAEAAIGAGITGALLLVALGRLGPEEPRRRRRLQKIGRYLSPPLLIVASLCAASALVLFSLRHLPGRAAGLAPQVAESLAASGVEHPVTAVLLNFRGYDTLLEIAVLLLAIIGIWCLGPAPVLVTQGPPSPVLSGLARVLLPVLVMAAGYVLWLGGHAPGGAFQAGALLAAALVLGMFAGQALSEAWSGLPLRLVLVVGFLVFLTTAAVPLAGSGLLLTYPPGWAKTLIMLVEALLTLSIAAILAAAVTGGRPTAALPYPPGPDDSRGVEVP